MRRIDLATVLTLVPSLLAQEPRPLPALADATRIHDMKADAARSWPELLAALAKLDVVFLGETHTDDTTHQVERHVLDQLLVQRQGKVVLSMEMFERDVQPVLDDYLAGRIDEAAFLQRARPWPNYHTAYRPLIEAAKAAKIPVVAANFPTSLRRALGGGKAAWDALTQAQRELVPAEVFPASDGYWERVDRAVRGHMGGGGGGGGSAEERLYDTQNLWDNAMGDSVAKARAAHPDSLVLHVAGGFHVAYRDGTAAQFVRRSPGSTFAVVEIAPTSELHFARPDRDREQADYVVYARTLAREENDGTWAVEVPAELRYQLEVPKTGKDWPLLVWLPDRATRPEDALAYWRTTAGDDTAIAVVQQPFPELQDDLALGGRYAFGDGFRADYQRTSLGVARIVEYVTRKFAIDAQKVVVAGEGDGGAVVLWTALYGEWVAADFVAIDPSDVKRLSMESLPDQKPVARSLALLANTVDEAKLEAVASDYRKVGVTTSVAHAGTQSRLLVHLHLATLAATKPAPPAAKQDGQSLCIVGNTGPRAREWAELLAATRRKAGTPVREVLSGPTDGSPGVVALTVGGDGAFPAASFADGSGIPLAGGPFGGTTVIVLPKGTSDNDRAAWLAHEKNKVLKRRSMFANIAIAAADGEPSLASVLGELRSKGRMRFLIVPAMWCADAATMQELKAKLGTAADGLDVSWLPGLGAELAKR